MVSVYNSFKVNELVSHESIGQSVTSHESMVMSQGVNGSMSYESMSYGSMSYVPRVNAS